MHLKNILTAKTVVKLLNLFCFFLSQHGTQQSVFEVAIAVANSTIHQNHGFIRDSIITMGRCYLNDFA